MPAFELQAGQKDFLTERTIFDGLLALLLFFCISPIPFSSSYISSTIYPSKYSASIKVSSHSSLIPLSAIKVSDGQSLIYIEKSLFFPLKISRIMNEIYCIYPMNYPLARIFVPSQKLAPGEIHLKISGENRINWIIPEKQEVSKQIVIIGKRSSGREISRLGREIYKLSSPEITWGNFDVSSHWEENIGNTFDILRRRVYIRLVPD